MKLKVKVVPNSKKDEIIEGTELVVRVTDPPEKGKANRKLIKLLSRHFGARIDIVSGFWSKEKIVEIIPNENAPQERLTNR